MTANCLPSNSSSSSPARIRIQGVRKSFGATIALRDVSLQSAAGEVHALIGENGAGKSTLMHILSGACAPDAGRMQLDDHPYEPLNPLHARRCGVSMIYQELNLAPHLSVAENILLGAEPNYCGWLHRSRRDDIARRALADLCHDDLPLDAPVRSLTIAARQIVEIARALINDPKLLIMDEPTSSLSNLDTENLFHVIGRLRSRGVTIIYISHFLEECRRICDRFTVLRDGQTVASGAMADVSIREVIRLMVGREVQEIYPGTHRAPGKTVLECRHLSGVKKPRNLELALHAGEIFGIAGLVGAGRTETVRACFGLDAIREGAVLVHGEIFTRQRPDLRLKQGMGLLSEDRKGEGLMLAQDLTENITLTRLEGFSRFGFIQADRREACARGWMERLRIRSSNPRQPVGELSGGNQQKVALARLLHHEADILLLDEPTRGIDVGSKAEIYRLMTELADAGKAILFISSYVPELLGICDTIGVMCRGMMVEVRPAKQWTEETIVAAAIGHVDPVTHG